MKILIIEHSKNINTKRNYTKKIQNEHVPIQANAATPKVTKTPRKDTFQRVKDRRPLHNYKQDRAQKLDAGLISDLDDRKIPDQEQPQDRDFGGNVRLNKGQETGPVTQLVQHDEPKPLA